jgi:hypothetical protein
MGNSQPGGTGPLFEALSKRPAKPITKLLSDKTDLLALHKTKYISVLMLAIRSNNLAAARGELSCSLRWSLQPVSCLRLQKSWTRQPGVEPTIWPR